MPKSGVLKLQEKGNITQSSLSKINLSVTKMKLKNVQRQSGDLSGCFEKSNYINRSHFSTYILLPSFSGITGRTPTVLGSFYLGSSSARKREDISSW